MAASQFQTLKIAKRLAAAKTRKVQKYVERKGVEGEAVEGDGEVQYPEEVVEEAAEEVAWYSKVEVVENKFLGTKGEEEVA